MLFSLITKIGGRVERVVDRGLWSRRGKNEIEGEGLICFFDSVAFL
jgi:hypothetical protein